MSTEVNKNYRKEKRRVKKSERADIRKEAKKAMVVAKLNEEPTSPRKMRLVVDLVRGVEVGRALDILKYSKKHASVRLEKVIRSAIANWESKNEGSRLEDANLCVKEIFVDEGRTLKRIRPKAQGRAGRIRKRSNHVTVILGTNLELDKE